VTGQKLARPGQAGHMDVVPASMRHRHFLAVTIPGGHGARVLRAGVLPHRQGVHVRPQQDRRPAAVGQYAGHAGAADAGLDREAALLQLPGYAPGGTPLLVR